jgi:hypothetical protein
VHGRRIGSAPAHRFGAVDKDTGAVGIDHEQREPCRAATAAGCNAGPGAAAGEDHVEVCRGAVAHHAFGSVEDKVVWLFVHRAGKAGEV